MSTFILATLWTTGEVLPFALIGRVLRERGHQVTLLTHSGHKKLADENGLTFKAVDTPVEYDRFVQDGRLFNEMRGYAEAYRRYVIPKVIHEFNLICDTMVPQNTVIVARATPGIAARIAMEKLAVPFVPVLTAPSHVGTMPLVAELFSSVFSDDLNRIRASLGVPPITDWAKWLLTPKRQLALWPQWFCPNDSLSRCEILHATFVTPRYTPQAVVGGDGPLDSLCRDLSPATVLITGGSGLFLETRLFSAAAEACYRLGRPAVIVTRFRELIPTDLPSNVRWCEYLPFVEAIPRVAAVVHHGGIGTCAIGLAAGIPQIVVGTGGDRPDNARRLRNLGVGEYLPPHLWTPDAFSDTLTRLLTSNTTRQSCAKAAHLFEAIEPAAMCGDLIEVEAASGSFSSGAIKGSQRPRASRSYRVPQKIR